MCLQETFLDNMDIRNELEKDFEAKVIMAPGMSRNSCGVAIFFRNDLEVQILKILNEPSGRLLLVDFLCRDKAFRIINVYAPNDEKDRKIFFRKFYPLLNTVKATFLLGDFNMVEFSTDKQGGNPASGYVGKDILQDLRKYFFCPSILNYSRIRSQNERNLYQACCYFCRRWHVTVSTNQMSWYRFYL